MSADKPPLEKLAWEIMRTCYDPEIPVNIIDLGLVFSCHVQPLPTGGHRINVKMGLTSPGCSMAEIIRNEVEAKLAGLPDVAAAEVAIVLDPPWDPSRMSDAARLELGLI